MSHYFPFRLKTGVHFLGFAGFYAEIRQTVFSCSWGNHCFLLFYYRQNQNNNNHKIPFMSDTYISEYLHLLKQLIAIPSFSKEETEAADCLINFLKGKNIPIQREKNNIWLKNKFFNAGKPTVLLNSHIDTVKPSDGWTIGPFQAIEKQGCIYGLGSNDAGGALVSLLAVFITHYDNKNLPYNLVFAASAEEEITGKNGMEYLLRKLPEIALGIVGEPTGMQMAIAEKGLLVIDCEATGRAGHAARNEGVNAIYKAIKDIQWIQDYTFLKISDLLGKVKMTVAQIEGGTKHNVVPDKCRFTVDIRTTELYTNQEIFDIIEKHITSKVVARSFRCQSSRIDEDHPIVQCAKNMKINCFGSPTMSDQVLMRFPSIKIGPGNSARSHAPDEYIKTTEIEQGINIYLKLLNELKL